MPTNTLALDVLSATSRQNTPQIIHFSGVVNPRFAGSFLSTLAIYKKGRLVTRLFIRRNYTKLIRLKQSFRQDDQPILPSPRAQG